MNTCLSFWGPAETAAEAFRVRAAIGFRGTIFSVFNPTEPTLYRLIQEVYTFVNYCFGYKVHFLSQTNLTILGKKIQNQEAQATTFLLDIALLISTVNNIN